MDATVLSGSASSSRAGRTCSGVMAGGRPSRTPAAGGSQALAGAVDRSEGCEDVEGQAAAGCSGVEVLV
ncbi:hypothetical protein ACFQ0O_11315 [Saccharopolyspora spinosporotrichia]